MLKKIIISITVLLIISGFIVSIATRNSFDMTPTGESKYPDYPISQLFNGGKIKSLALDIEESLNAEPFVVRVSFDGERKLSHAAMESKIEILEVYKRNTNLVGKSITKYELSHFNLKFQEFRTNISNLMTAGDDYLTFGLQEENPYNKNEDIFITSHQKEQLIAFRIKENNDIIFDLEKVKNGEVKFKDVEQNEFLASRKELLNALINIKAKYFAKYNITY